MPPSRSNFFCGTPPRIMPDFVFDGFLTDIAFRSPTFCRQIAPNSHKAKKHIPVNIARHGNIITKNAETNIAKRSLWSSCNSSLWRKYSASSSGVRFFITLRILLNIFVVIGDYLYALLFRYDGIDVGYVVRIHSDYRLVYHTLYILSARRLFRFVLDMEQIFAVFHLFLYIMTGYEMSRLYLHEGRRNSLALFASHITTGVELASFGRTNGARNVAL